MSALLDYVRAGETVVILDRGRPVARLEPAVSAAEDPAGRLRRLERAGIVRVATRPAPTELMSTKPPEPRPGASALRALLSERRESR